MKFVFQCEMVVFHGFSWVFHGFFMVFHGFYSLGHDYLPVVFMVRPSCWSMRSVTCTRSRLVPGEAEVPPGVFDSGDIKIDLRYWDLMGSNGISENGIFMGFNGRLMGFNGIPSGND